MINLNNITINNIINLIIHKNIYWGNPLIIENPINQNIFLQKKRFLENPNLNYNNMFSFQKETNFCISKNNLNIHKNELQKNYFTSELIKPSFSYCDYNINLNKQNKDFKNFIPIDKENKIENYFIINNVYNVNNNLMGNINNDFINNNSKLCNKENLIINDNFNENNNISTDSNKLINLNNASNFLKKNYYFNVTHIKNEKHKKKIIENYINRTENNNEIKVLKNNKVVYVNTFLLNSNSTSKNIKKLNKIAFIGRNKRSSRYRGVSKNGNQWQVLMMINKNKSYIGSYPSEELAARIYDILALKNRGIKARTNFIYNSKQIKKICEMEINIKSENINDIISQLIE